MNLIKPVFLAIMLVPGIAAALPADRQQKIEIESNSANLDSQKGVSVYLGDVIMKQGSTLITGDKITIYSDQNRQVTKVIAEGKRAFYEEKLEGKRGKVEAWGKTINYNVTGDRIELLSQAQLSQDGDLFKGEKINYDLKQQTVSATGQPVNKGSKGRVQMVIQPRPEQTQPAAGG